MGVGLLPFMCRMNTDKLVSCLRLQWKNLSGWKSSIVDSDLRELIPQSPTQVVMSLETEIAFEAGKFAFDKKMDPDNHLIAKELLESLRIEAEPWARLLAKTRLWAALRKFADLNRSFRRTDTLGISQYVEELVSEDPTTWIDSIPLIMSVKPDIEPLADVVTLMVRQQLPKDVDARLVECISSDNPDVRDRSRGLLAKLTGGAVLQSDQAKDLISLGVRQLDGKPAFPNPLDIQSGIWIGSLALEKILADAIDQAALRFGGGFAHSPRMREENHVERLLSHLEFSFESVNTRVKTLVEDGLPKGAIHYAHRSVDPQMEEPVYGCDVAILVNGAVNECVKFTSCELVQVKKPERDASTDEFKEKWKIDIQQLKKLLKHSQGAVYWLFGTSGEVFVCPAKLLWAFAVGQEKETQSSFIIHYCDIRSASVPLRQFMVQLVMGLWLGSTDEQLLRFVRGEEAGIRPREIVEITVRSGGENG